MELCLFALADYSELMEQVLVVFGVGLAGGALSGLLGIGGGIITAPLLLYVPVLLGQVPLSMHAVSGLTITQSLFSGLLGSLFHGWRGAVDRKLAAVMSAAGFVAALAGGAGSELFSHDLLLGVFAALASTAAVVIFQPGWKGDGGDYAPGGFSVPGAVGVAAGTGLLGGLVGQGGSFLLIPAMVMLLKVPLRIAMGSNLVIVFFASLAGFLGKAATGQVSATLALALLAGIAPGSWIGSRLSARVPTHALRLTLGGVIVAACARMLWDLVT